ncbi:unnamed protein product [Rotaria sp. Silwood2]|nr:unnamed protein product [Rotaria sp. Silwood2]CAF2894268.1 unnamed protein product [Rotaria sp. Silwood2]CAF3343395.1 unnamed protein product [Rotaria sp. Silwood2]CAF3923500.1 unnamed protein product [Rotaria sp. Silwood2]CAF4199810.1 unnamed protein product [Rotaria sp. Silwood2]
MEALKLQYSRTTNCTQEFDPDGEYAFEVLCSEQDTRECARLTAHSFSSSNPMTVFKGISPDIYYENVALPLMMSVIDQRLSLFARQRATGEIVGCIIAADFYLKPHYNVTTMSGIAHEDLIADLDTMSYGDFNLEEQLTPNSVLYFLLQATKVGEEGKGVASRLIQLACDYARKTKGFKYAHAQSSNPAMRHIYAKMGGQVTSQIDPTTWIWKNGGSGNEYPFREWSAGPLPNIRIRL